MPQSEYQAILLVSFGGPEGPDDVIPFLENVLRGKNVPRERMLAVIRWAAVGTKAKHRALQDCEDTWQVIQYALSRCVADHSRSTSTHVKVSPSTRRTPRDQSAADITFFPAGFTSPSRTS